LVILYTDDSTATANKLDAPKILAGSGVTHLRSIPENEKSLTRHDSVARSAIDHELKGIAPILNIDNLGEFGA
jgi:hypothetical protein